MKRILIGATVAALVAVPAAVGLWGNASFSQAVPVRVPASGQIATPSPAPTDSSPITDDNGGDIPRDQRVEPGDDRHVQGGTPAPEPSASQSGADDNGGDIPRDQRVEPGDDRDGSSGGSGSGSSGSGSSDGGSVDDDHGGHGSDD